MKIKLISILVTILILSILIQSCNSIEDTFEITGPYKRNTLISMLNLETIPVDEDGSHFFIIDVNNRIGKAISFETDKYDQIFPNHLWYRSYMPYSAIQKSWNRIEFESDSNYYQRFDLLPGESKSFWSKVYFDPFVDSLVVNYTYYTKDQKIDLDVYRFYKPMTKIKPEYSLIETSRSINSFKRKEVDLKINGPFFYHHASKILETQISYRVESEEVFVFEITNNHDKDLYVPVWNNYEINIDKVFTYSPFTFTSKQYFWNEQTSKKSTDPIDTVIVKPNETLKFWDSYQQIWPTTDSIVFSEIFKFEDESIEITKEYKLNKN